MNHTGAARTKCFRRSCILTAGILAVPDDGSIVFLVGVDSDEHFQAMAEDAMKAGNTLVNPRQTTVKDFVAMYYKAM